MSDNTREMDTKRAAWFSYIGGWSDGAGRRECDPSNSMLTTSTEDYRRGYTAGYEARNAEAKRSAADYGYEPLVIKPAQESA